MMENKVARSSIIAPYIDGLVTEKRASGFLYDDAERTLDKFDAYCLAKGLDTLQITKEFLSDWMERRTNEGAFNQGKRISCVRQLLLYMASHGIVEYIPNDFCHFEKPAPHIFTPEEITEFFSVLDSYVPKQSSRASLVRLTNEYRLLFRWYCCCGLRNSEAAGIASENVDLNTGVLTILNSKGNKDRLVYLPDDLKESSARYLKYLTDTLGTHPQWFFPSSIPDKPLPNTSVDAVFKRFWNMTRFAGCSNKPTVHDFRFTFVVTRMNRWAEEDLDLNVMVPYLSRSLGHKSIHETLYYYYLVQDAYKTVEKKDTYANAVIPEVNCHG